MLLRSYRYILIVKICSLIIGGICFAGGLRNIHKTQVGEKSTHVFLLNLSSSMNIKDIHTQDTTISRLDAAIRFIQQSLTYTPQQSVGVIGCDETICSYLIPPTHDHAFIEERLQYIHTQLFTHKKTSGYISIEDPHTYITLLTDGSPNTTLQSFMNSNNVSSILASQTVGLGKDFGGTQAFPPLQEKIDWYTSISHNTQSQGNKSRRFILGLIFIALGV